MLSKAFLSFRTITNFATCEQYRTCFTSFPTIAKTTIYLWDLFTKQCYFFHACAADFLTFNYDRSTAQALKSRWIKEESSSRIKYLHTYIRLHTILRYVSHCVILSLKNLTIQVVGVVLINDEYLRVKFKKYLASIVFRIWVYGYCSRVTNFCMGTKKHFLGLKYLSK